MRIMSKAYALIFGRSTLVGRPCCNFLSDSYTSTSCSGRRSNVYHCRFGRSVSSLVHSSSNLLQTMTTWHQIYHKLSRSRGQRSISQRDVTYILTKNAIYQARIGWPSSNFVQTIPQHSATWYMFKVTRSNIQIARLPLNLVQSLTMANVKVTGSKVKVTA